jgi:phosphoketolase
MTVTESRDTDAVFAEWAKGYGRIRHTSRTRMRIRALARRLEAAGTRGDGVPLFDLLSAVDRLTSAAMWLVVHQSYARRVYLDGRPLRPEDFKADPEGHTGGALNMVPAYVGYMAANAVTGETRSWIMGQGHCVAAIDSVNLLVDNMTPAHAARYAVTDEGLTRYVGDFYSYRLTDDGRQASPLGSHVNAHTAGGIVEGGYLGFVELEYVHMPLPGERLVAFLSDGAFEEQRGSDWAPRWWRAEDSGPVMPIMIANGRRIDQRTTMNQEGGVNWFVRHLRLNSFDPIVFDGRDPAAFVWAVLEMETRLAAAAERIRRGEARYPVPLPHGVAVAPKGAGFYGEGTNLAHNLPLGGNPHTDPVAARHFNASARRLWVPPDELKAAAGALQHHHASGRPRERDHPLTRRDVTATAPAPPVRPVPDDRRDRGRWTRGSPMTAIDEGFLAAVRANPRLRPRVGNPDEMRSNRLQGTLDALRFRVTAPEPGIPEAVDGKVVTALNEEAVAAAALGNKGGINMIATYEAFGAKMHGIVRQEIVFADHLNAAGRPPRWLSVPLVLTSHTWENAKNEQSHQDPMLAEALLGEPSNVSRVLFVADANTAAAVIAGVYAVQGQIWALIVAKSATIPDLFTAEEAAMLLRDGGLRLDWAGHETGRSRLVMTAIGAYQLVETLRASERLAERGVAHSVVYLLEPARFRTPRGPREAAHLTPAEARARLYPDAVTPRLFVAHTRPEPMLGVLAPLWRGARTTALGFLNHGGTLNVEGMLFVNESTWGHAVAAAGRLLDIDRDQLLTADEQAALDHRRSPEGVIIGRE